MGTDGGPGRADVLLASDGSSGLVVRVDRAAGRLPLIGEAVAHGWQVWTVGEPRLGARSGADALTGFAKMLSEGSTDAVHALRGRFVIVGRRDGSDEWHAWTDRFGTSHLYLGQRLGVAIGTDVDAVARAVGATELDWEGLASFFSLGFFVGDRTHRRDVRIVEPGTHVVIGRDGSVRSRRWWDWPSIQMIDDIDDAVDSAKHTIDVAVAALAGDAPLVLPLSGGLDSRTLLAAAIRCGADVRTVSYGYTPWSREIEIGAELAAVATVPHEAAVVPPYVLERLPSILASVQGFQGVAGTRQAGVSEVLARAGDVVLGGHWGDVWFDDVHVPPGADDVDAALALFAKRGSAWLLDTVVRPRMDAEPEEVVRSMLSDAVERVAAIEPRSARLKALKTEQWSFRWTLASVRAFELAGALRLPFYDADVADVGRALAPSLLKGRQVQIELLRRHSPALARVAWEETGRPLGSPPPGRARRAARKIARGVTGRRHVGRGWEQQILGEQLEGVRTVLSGILDLVDEDDVGDLLRRASKSPSPTDGYALEQLLTFAAWLGRT